MKNFYILLVIFLFIAGCGKSTSRKDISGSLLEKISSLSAVKASFQAIIILGESPGKSGANTALFEKKDGVWTALSDGFPAVIGKRGFASIGEKKEGDGKSPTGVFGLGTAFGYSSSCDTKMPYRQSGKNDYWVDDLASQQYNTWVQGSPDAKSAEKMLRDDVLYKWGIAVDYNTNPAVPGKGSAIFLHVWNGQGTITAGCAAFAEENLLRILKWLDPDKKPVVIMGIPSEIEKLVKK